MTTAHDKVVLFNILASNAAEVAELRDLIAQAQREEYSPRAQYARASRLFSYRGRCCTSVELQRKNTALSKLTFQLRACLRRDFGLTE
jgi:hypothetical protein